MEQLQLPNATRIQIARQKIASTLNNYPGNKKKPSMKPWKPSDLETGSDSALTAAMVDLTKWVADYAAARKNGNNVKNSGPLGTGQVILYRDLRRFDNAVEGIVNAKASGSLVQKGLGAGNPQEKWADDFQYKVVLQTCVQNQPHPTFHFSLRKITNFPNPQLLPEYDVAAPLRFASDWQGYNRDVEDAARSNEAMAYENFAKGL
ncbi:hypothetical protein [Cryptosporangium sp. NPDC048952]|uniref:hypothetical protein n=1 Tax=Cryptosporangium sp. NPDC048952 TaxID=3363961 RepID=UPI0037129B63